MDKKQRKANQKLQQAQNFAENLRANQNLPLEEKALRTKVISPEIGKHLKFAILKENISLIPIGLSRQSVETYRL